MSLDSCVACGHALSIADHRCRHCSPAKTEEQRGIRGLSWHLLAWPGALIFGVLIYRVFLS